MAPELAELRGWLRDSDEMASQRHQENLKSISDLSARMAAQEMATRDLSAAIISSGREFSAGLASLDRRVGSIEQQIEEHAERLERNDEAIAAINKKANMAHGGWLVVVVMATLLSASLSIFGWERISRAIQALSQPVPSKSELHIPGTSASAQ